MQAGGRRFDPDHLQGGWAWAVSGLGWALSRDEWGLAWSARVACAWRVCCGSALGCCVMAVGLGMGRRRCVVWSLWIVNQVLVRFGRAGHLGWRLPCGLGWDLWLGAGGGDP